MLLFKINRQSLIPRVNFSFERPPNVRQDGRICGHSDNSSGIQPKPFSNEEPACLWPQ